MKRGVLLAIAAALLIAPALARAVTRRDTLDVQDAPLLEPLTSLFDEPMNLDEALENPNIAAILASIRWAEGTADPDGYRRHFGGELFESFADHPRRVITALSGGREIKSTAAGAYQFLEGTWDDVAPRIGASDFSPYWQDRAAVYLIKRRGALDDAASGRFHEALAKLRQEWASLPGAGYGQPEKSAEALARVYADNGGNFA